MPLPTITVLDWNAYDIQIGDDDEFITKFNAYLTSLENAIAEQNALFAAYVDWATRAEDSLIPAASGGDEVDDYSFVHWLAKAVAEKVAAEAAKAAAEAWAITPEDTPVPVSAGGDGVTTFSSLHHRNKAALANGIDDNTIGLLTTYSSTKIEQGLLESKGATNDQLANIAVNAFNIAALGGMSVQEMVDGVIDTFNDQTGIETGRSIGVQFDADGYRNATDAIDYPPAHSDTYVKATSAGAAPTFSPYRATDPATSKTGSDSDTSWRSSNGQVTNQRFHIDIGVAARLTSVEYNNFHQTAGGVGAGVKNFTLWGSNDPTAFSNLTYATNTNWTQLSPSITQFAQHVESDVADDRSFTVGYGAAYRYYAFKFADNWGDASLMGLRSVRLTTAVPEDAALVTKASTALASPDEALVVIQQQDIVAVTINTDLTAWVTRTPLSTYTTLAATDNKLRLTGHGFSNGRRVILSTATGDNFATGLNGVTAYYVVNATANDFEVSLTSGGAAVAITADNGATQSVTDYAQAVLAEAIALSNGRILTGTADLSSQAAGTDISTVLLTDNLKEMEIKARSTQWA